MSTRKDMFTGELVAALEMAQHAGVPLSRMRSSWAGALGQPQFLPTSYIKYAADGDGDGKADIWQSDADTLASMANYLQQSGWVAGRDWGFEVAVPQGVSCALEGPDRGKTVAQWSAMGIERVNGKPFPASEMGKEAFLLMPAGRFGPAFIVTPNFYVLKEYNESDLYALFIGNAADRIAFGGGAFAGRWSRYRRYASLRHCRPAAQPGEKRLRCRRRRRPAGLQDAPFDRRMAAAEQHRAGLFSEPEAAWRDQVARCGNTLRKS